MNPDLELIQQYAQAIQATGLLEEDTVNGITAMVDRAREQFRVADEQGIPPETLQLLPDDQRAAMQEVLMQVQRSMAASSAPLGRPDFGTGTPPDMSMPQAIPTQREPSMTQSDMDRAMANNKLADEMAPNYALPTSLRPKPRPANLGTMGQTRPQLRPQLRPRDYDITNPKYEVVGGGQIRRQDIINSPSLTEEQKRAMLGGNLPMDYDITNPKYEK